jgi:hypothetical protein
MGSFHYHYITRIRRKPEMKKALYTKQFTASFKTETFDRIKEITDQGDISMGEWMRVAADEKLAMVDQENDKGENQS